MSDAGVDERPARMTIPYDLSERDSEAPAEGDESILARLKDSAQHFEESHPTLSGMIGSVIR